MNKKWLIGLLSVCICMQGGSVIAAGVEEDLTQEAALEYNLETAEEENGMYITRSGKITELHKKDSTCEILVGTLTEGFRLALSENILIINAETHGILEVGDLEAGMSITAVLHKNMPMTLSIPPLYGSPAAIVVNSHDKQVEVSYFDEELINETNTLQLNLGENTQIQNSRGERRIFTAEDIKNENAIVVYTNSTRSIPAQTTPEFVMIMTSGEETMEQEEVVVESEDSVSKETKASQIETEYVLLREQAEALGFEISWNTQTKTVVLEKEGKTVSITAGEEKYSYNGEEVLLNETVKLQEGLIYVPAELIEGIK